MYIIEDTKEEDWDELEVDESGFIDAFTYFDNTEESE
jgi:hypothetical protein